MIEKNRSYQLTGGLTDEDMSKMHNAMLDIIENVGLKVPHDGILKILSEKEGVKIDGDVVKFEPHLIEKAISEMDYPDYVKNADYIINGGDFTPVFNTVFNLASKPFENQYQPPWSLPLVQVVFIPESYGV